MKLLKSLYVQVLIGIAAGVILGFVAPGFFKTQVFNNTSGLQAQPGTVLRVTGNSIFDNGTNFICNGGSILTANNNSVAGGGLSCGPTGSMTVQ